ncbi:hypothetical protein SLEP1_g792 [Rubroshorea leprosula]|uniref:Uncharacterized protein n=1 Tax=Rubroshorea leprosula TaxID=152421 RepID=A0AAV5HBS1_9ROSI|nr:hypothetical protein SLEP1_g792 [Rubroshorea leprosula]
MRMVQALEPLKFSWPFQMGSGFLNRVLDLAGIKACKEAMQPVDEERYEISLDNHGEKL